MKFDQKNKLCVWNTDFANNIWKICVLMKRKYGLTLYNMINKYHNKKKHDNYNGNVFLANSWVWKVGSRCNFCGANTKAGQWESSVEDFPLDLVAGSRTPRILLLWEPHVLLIQNHSTKVTCLMHPSCIARTHFNLSGLRIIMCAVGHVDLHFPLSEGGISRSPEYEHTWI